MKYIDLHVHTIASDGTYSPTDTVALAADKKLAAIAITDHDTVSGINEALTAGTVHNVEIIPGIELSCAYNKKEIHILGYYINHNDDELVFSLNELKNIRDQRNNMIAEKFNKLGIPVDIDELRMMYPGAVLTRAHFAAYVHSKGCAGSIKEVFDRYLNDYGPCYVTRKKLDPADTIRLIHKSGGLAFLAHPILYRLGNTELDKLVHRLSDLGLDGIEAIYSSYTLSDESKVRILAKENHLIISGGSDFHGANKPSIEIGTGKGHLHVPYDVLTNIRSKL